MNNLKSFLEEKQFLPYVTEQDTATKRIKKIPASANGIRIDYLDPDQWMTYAEAVQAVSENPKLAGVGFVFRENDPFYGIDLDHIENEIEAVKAGDMDNLLGDFLNAAPTYAEYSCSGTGVHILACGTPPATAKHRRGQVEFYYDKRFFVLTRNTLPGHEELAECGQQLEALLQKHLGKPQAKISTTIVAQRTISDCSDAELLEIMKRSANWSKIEKLIDGDFSDYTSQSNADLAMCNHLAFYTAKDPARMDSLFRGTKLMRSKWDEKHGEKTYGEITIQKAIEDCTKVYDRLPNSKRQGPASPATPAPTPSSSSVPAPTSPAPIILESTVANFNIIKGKRAVPVEDGQLAGDYVTLTFQNRAGKEIERTFQATDFDDLRRFKAKLASMDFTFYGSSLDLYTMKRAIVPLTQHETVHIHGFTGIYLEPGDNVYIGHHGCIHSDGSISDARLAPQSVYQKVTPPANLQTLCSEPVDPALLDDLQSFNAPAYVYSVVGQAGAMLLNAHFERLTIRLNHLVMIGEQGSGKSNTMEHILLPLCGTDAKPTPCGTGTKFTQTIDLSMSNCNPVVWEEFKPSNLSKTCVMRLSDLARNAYDRSPAERGRKDLSCKAIPLRTPLVIVGEESFTEGAIKERSNILYFTKANLTAVRQAAFERLIARKEALYALHYKMLLTALALDPNAVYQLRKDASAYFTTKLQGRVRNTAVNVLCGLMLFCKATGAGWPLTEMAKTIEANLVENVLENGTASKTEVGRFLETLSDMTELNNEYHFAKGIDFLYQSTNDSVLFNFSIAYQKACAYAKTIGKALISGEDIKRQLRLNPKLLIATSAQQRYADGKQRRSYEIRLSELPTEIADKFRT